MGGVVAMGTSRVAVPSHMPLTEDVDGTGMGGPDWTLSGRRPAVRTASGSSEACYPPAVGAGVSRHGLVSRFRERAGPSPRSWTVGRVNEVVQPRGSRQLAICGGIG